MTDASTAPVERLNDQLAWYDSKSQVNRRYHVAAILSQVIIGASIPICAWITPPLVLALLGGAIVVINGASSAFQWEYNWINYRATTERLKHEKYLYAAQAGPYKVESDAERTRLLAERVEGVVSREHSAWITLQEEKLKRA
jgi:hypothetical protein